VARVELRDIVTEEERAAASALRVAPGQERFVASVEESFLDAGRYPEALARYWAVYDGDALVGFTMISDGIGEEVLAADPTLVGPYFLWRVLIDERHQRRGYGSAVLETLADYVRARGGTELLTSYTAGEGSPGPFYERYGFVPTDRVVEGERVLRLDLSRGAGTTT
jgi:diamine N-acetyltransferase